MVNIDYGQIFEASRNEIYIFSPDTLQFIEVNRAARINTGYSLDKFLDLTILDLQFEYTLSSFSDLVTPLFTGGQETVRFDTLHKRKDGSIYPVEVNLQITDVDKEPVFVAIILDVTKQHHLTSEMTRMGQIFEDSLNEIYVFDASTMLFSSVNRGARNNLGYTLEELKQMTPIDIKPEYSFETFTPLLIPLQTGETEILLFETIHQRKDGSTYPVEIHLQLNKDGEKSVFVAIVLDITERKKTTRQLLDLTIQNQRVHLVQNFIQDTSHEFRTSLSIVNTKSYLLKKSDLSENQKKQVSIIEAQVTRIEKLVNSLQESSILENLEHIIKEPTCINCLLEDIINNNKMLCQHKNIQVQVDFSDDHIATLGDKNLLQTAIYNVIKNACDFHHNNGFIHITTKNEGDHIVITIKDNGSGISPEDLPHVFDYLYRGNKARPMDGGYGLGLSITRRIIQLHEGIIHVDSEIEQGSEFTIKLPVHDMS